MLTPCFFFFSAGQLYICPARHPEESQGPGGAGQQDWWWVICLASIHPSLHPSRKYFLLTALPFWLDFHLLLLDFPVAPFLFSVFLFLTIFFFSLVYHSSLKHTNHPIHANTKIHSKSQSPAELWTMDKCCLIFLVNLFVKTERKWRETEQKSCLSNIFPNISCVLFACSIYTPQTI